MELQGRIKRAARKRNYCALLLLWLIGQLFVSSSAFANTTITGYEIAPNFTCSGGSASGELYQANCSGSPKEGKVFSYFVCRFEEIIQKALAEIFCAILEDAKPAVMAALTLMILFLGISLLMGVVPFTAKEMAIVAAKFSLVMAFATNAEYMIGIGYKLFMGVAKEGIIMVLEYLFQGGSYNQGGDVYAYFDKILQELMQKASEGTKEGNQCQNAIFALVVITIAALPPLALMAFYFMIKLLWIVLRAVFGYCQGILGVTFLTTLAPIYVTFALFSFTRPLFDKWIQHLISFSFQMVIVFGFLGMMFNIFSKIADDMQDYTNLVRPYKQEFAQHNTRWSFDNCGVCEMARTGPKEAPRCASDRVLHITEMVKDENFMHFASVKIIAMIIMFYIFDIMMDFVPQMARFLSGPRYAAQIGGGDGAGPTAAMMPGEQGVKYALQRGANEFSKGITSPDAVVRGMAGFTGGFLAGDGTAQNPGLIGNVTRGATGIAGGAMLWNALTGRGSGNDIRGALGGGGGSGGAPSGGGSSSSSTAGIPRPMPKEPTKPTGTTSGVTKASTTAAEQARLEASVAVYDANRDDAALGQLIAFGLEKLVDKEHVTPADIRFVLENAARAAGASDAQAAKTLGNIRASLSSDIDAVLARAEYIV